MTTLERLHGYLHLNKSPITLRGLLILVYIHRDGLNDRSELMERLGVSDSSFDNEISTLRKGDRDLIFRSGSTYRVPPDLSAFIDELIV